VLDAPPLRAARCALARIIHLVARELVSRPSLNGGRHAAALRIGSEPSGMRRDDYVTRVVVGQELVSCLAVNGTRSTNDGRRAAARRPTRPERGTSAFRGWWADAAPMNDPSQRSRHAGPPGSIATPRSMFCLPSPNCPPMSLPEGQEAECLAESQDVASAAEITPLRVSGFPIAARMRAPRFPRQRLSGWHRSA